MYDIKEDTSGNLWLATYVCGVFRYDVSKKEWKNYVHNEKDEKSLSNNKVLSVFEDSRRNVWLTTQGRGICLFHPTAPRALQPIHLKQQRHRILFQILRFHRSLR